MLSISLRTWGNCEDISNMIDYLSPKGLYIECQDILNSPEEADAFIKEIEKKCKGKF